MTAQWTGATLRRVDEEHPDPADLRFQARYVYDCALSVLDQVPERAPTRHEQERLAGLALDLRQAIIALADASDARAVIPLPRTIRWREEHLAKAAQATLAQLRQLYKHMVDLDLAAASVPRQEASDATAHG